MTVLGTHEAPHFKIAGVDTYLGRDGQSATPGRTTIIIALCRPRMTVAMLMTARMAKRSDVDIAVLVSLSLGDAFPMAVLMDSRHGATPMIAVEGRKNETHGQEYE